MIIDLTINVLLTLVSVIFVFLPVVSVSSIPYYGEDIASVLLTVVTTWNAFMVTFPYAVVLWNIFLYVILPFEFLLLIGKFFLGSRLPSNH